MSALDEVKLCLQDYDGTVFQIVKERESEKSVELFLRVFREDEWKRLMVKVLQVIREAPAASSFLGTSYFLRDEVLVYGWVMSLYGTTSTDDFITPLKELFGIEPEGVPQEQVPVPRPALIRPKRPQPTKAPLTSRGQVKGGKQVQEMPLGQGAVIGVDPLTGRGARPTAGD